MWYVYKCLIVSNDIKKTIEKRRGPFCTNIHYLKKENIVFMDPFWYPHDLFGGEYFYYRYYYYYYYPHPSVVY